jgi:hypothetical protein
MEKDENFNWLLSKLEKMGFGDLPDLPKINIQGKDFYIDKDPYYINIKDQKVTVTPFFLHSGILNKLKYALMIEGKPGELSEKIQNSIERISKILDEKGFGRFFSMDGHGTEVLPDLLKTYCRLALINPIKVNFPFVVSTYTHFNKEDDLYVKCSFTIDLDEKKGLKMNHLQVVSSEMSHKVLEHWEKSLTNAADIPYKSQVNYKVLPINLKKKKSHKKKR